MRAVLITIGDEILIGQVLNSNAAYLSQKLLSIGIPVERTVTVADREPDIMNELRSCFKNYDIIITTGGLGPTHDDITKKCIARFFRSKLILDKKVLVHVRNLSTRRQLNMPEINVEQAMRPDISDVLPNKIGTAPGIFIKKNKKLFFALPGVPREMKYIMENSVLPYLRFKLRGRELKTIRYRTLHAIGIPESLLFEKIGNISELEIKKPDSETKIAFLPGDFEIRIRVTARLRRAANVRSAEAALNSAVKKLKNRAGEYIYSYDESPIEKTVGSILKRKRLTLSVAESCTGGLIASKITDVPGSSHYFLESVIAYTNETKTRLLKVKPATLKKYGAVSRETAVEMAEGIRKISGADIGISSTCIAGPSGGTKQKPVGLLWIGYADEKGSFAKDFYFTKDRLRNKEMMSKMALELLRRRLLKLNMNL